MRSVCFRLLLLILGIRSSSLLAQGPADLSPRNIRRQLIQEANLDHYRDSTGTVRPDLWEAGVLQARQNAIQGGSLIPNAPQMLGGQWVQIGPAPLKIDSGEEIFQGKGPDSGEVVDIAIDPRGGVDRVLYIATNDGGIWKTTDGGVTWTPKTDFGCLPGPGPCPSLSMGSVTLDPRNPDIVYAGTGNPYDGGCLFSKGVGIYKSVNGGDTWTIKNPGGIFTAINPPCPPFPTSGIRRLLHPPNPPGFNIDLLLVATANGLFRSIDGGEHFGNNPNVDNGLPVLGGPISDVHSDTSSPFTVYAAVAGVGIMRSNDGGATFGADNLFNYPNSPMPGTFGFIAFSQSTLPFTTCPPPGGRCPGSIYASVAMAMPGNRFLNLYRFDYNAMGGGIWTLLPNAAMVTQGYMVAGNTIFCQCGYDQTIGVDPQDSQWVYLGFQELFLSTNGGVTFNPTPVSRNQIHWDHHALVFSPRRGGAPTRVWAGTDGGVHSSADGGTTWASLNETIATNLFKHIDIGRYSTFNRKHTYGGTQDTGTIERTGEFTGNDWHLAIDGDGGGVAVSPEDAEDAFGADNGIFITTSSAGESWDLETTVGEDPTSAWRTVIDRDGSDVFTVTATSNGFRPGNRIYRSTDDGDDFSLDAHIFGAGAQSITISEVDANLIWVGLTNGNLERTTNALANPPTWTAIMGPVAGQPVSGIAINPRDTTEAVITYEGFAGARRNHVFLTRDNGAMWADISTNLVDLPTHSVVIDPGDTPTIVISNDAAVMHSTDRGVTWQVLGAGLPLVSCRQLAIDYSITPSLLRLGTYGRSVFELR